MLDRSSASSSALAVPVWAWLTSLSLDAPLVALVWQGLFHKTFGVALTWQAAACLGLSVWLIYLADRLLDALRLDLAKPHTMRHALYARHWRAALSVWLVLLCLTTSLVVTSLSAAQLRGGVVLGVVVLIYLLTVHAFGSLARYSKEVQVGTVFAAGTTLLLWHDAGSQLVVYTLLFAGLCSLNCLFISLWEQAVDAAQGCVSLVGSSPFSRSLIPLLAAVFVAVCLLVFMLHPTSLVAALILSATALLVLHSLRQRFATEALRVLADVVLLSPLLFLVSR